MTALSEQQIQKYSRQILLREVGGIGQKKILESCFCVAGHSETANWVAKYLTASGMQQVEVMEQPQVRIKVLVSPTVQSLCPIEIVQDDAGADVRQLSVDLRTLVSPWSESLLMACQVALACQRLVLNLGSRFNTPRKTKS